MVVGTLVMKEEMLLACLLLLLHVVIAPIHRHMAATGSWEAPTG